MDVGGNGSLLLHILPLGGTLTVHCPVGTFCVLLAHVYKRIWNEVGSMELRFVKDTVLVYYHLCGALPFMLRM